VKSHGKKSGEQNCFSGELYFLFQYRRKLSECFIAGFLFLDKKRSRFTISFFQLGNNPLSCFPCFRSSLPSCSIKKLNADGSISIVRSTLFHDENAENREGMKKLTNHRLKGFFYC